MVVATMAFLLVGVAAAVAAPGGDSGTSKVTCDFSDLDVANMVESIVSRLPQKYTPPYPRPQGFPGLTIGSLVISNLDRLKLYGAQQSYCRYGSRFVQVDLATESPGLTATIPWKYCGGEEGEAAMNADAKVTVIFKVTEGSGDNATKLVHHSGPTFSTVEINWVRLDGAGNMLGTVYRYIRLLAPQTLQEFWKALLDYDLRNVLQEIA